MEAATILATLQGKGFRIRDLGVREMPTFKPTT